MTTGNLHPAIEKGLADLFTAIREEFVRLPPGGTMVVRISADRDGRVSPDGTHIEPRIYPLKESA